ncbi:MAG TPA: hypothetical protein VJT13_08155 [Xanthobacteraceae bacterium]|nr:hypothetical protein [Xanthobacteraceae bacterium]
MFRQASIAIAAAGILAASGSAFAGPRFLGQNHRVIHQPASTGTVKQIGSSFTFNHQPPDRRIQVRPTMKGKTILQN